MKQFTKIDKIILHKARNNLETRRDDGEITKKALDEALQLLEEFELGREAFNTAIEKILTA